MLLYSNKKPNDEPSIDVIGLMKQNLPEYVAKCLISAGYDEIEVLSTMGTSEKQGNSIEKIESFIEKRYADSSEHTVIHFHLTHLSFHQGIELKYATLFEN